MPIEIERKFLVANDGWRARWTRKEHLRDGLISHSPERKVRVRVRDGHARLGLNRPRRWRLPCVLMHGSTVIVLGLLSTACATPPPREPVRLHHPAPTQMMPPRHVPPTSPTRIEETPTAPTGPSEVEETPMAPTAPTEVEQTPPASATPTKVEEVPPPTPLAPTPGPRAPVPIVRRGS